jgi:hypothetical protein
MVGIISQIFLMLALVMFWLGLARKPLALGGFGFWDPQAKL